MSDRRSGEDPSAAANMTVGRGPNAAAWWGTSARGLPYLLSFVAIALFSWLIQTGGQFGGGATDDFVECLRPGAWLLMSGRNPHVLPNCNFMTWSLIPLLPLSLPPPEIGRAALSSIAILVFAYSARRLGATWETAIVIAGLTTYTLHNLWNPNTDWMVALGYVLPPPVGLLFVSVKPQVGAGIGLYWVIESWRKGGLQSVFRLATPLILVVGLSLTMYGFATAGKAMAFAGRDWNWSIWPFGVPIGVALMVAAVRRRSVGCAIAAAPFLSPYVGYYSWPLAILGMPRRVQLGAVALNVIIVVTGLALLS